MNADDQRAADDGWTPIPETAVCPAECEDCQVTVDRLRAEVAETRAVLGRVCGAGDFMPMPASTLVAAIEAARGGAR